MTNEEVETHVENLSVVMSQPIIDSFKVWPEPHDLECSLEAMTRGVSKIIVAMFEHAVAKGDTFPNENSVGHRTVSLVKVCAEHIVDTTVPAACEKMGIPYRGVVEEEAAE